MFCMINILRSSNTQLGRLRRFDSFLVGLKLLFKLATWSAELINNTRAATNVQFRSHHVVKIRPDRFEKFSVPHPLNEVVLSLV